MSGEGFAADAISIVRSNSLLLKRQKFKDIKNLVIDNV
jgi:hypothetical protein